MNKFYAVVDVRKEDSKAKSSIIIDGVTRSEAEANAKSFIEEYGLKATVSAVYKYR